MRKFLSKLIHKIPPFRHIYSRLEALEKENKSLQDQLKKAKEENADLGKKYASLEEKIDLVNQKHDKEEKKLASKFNTLDTRQKQEVQQRINDYNRQQNNLSDAKRSINKQIGYYYFKGLEPDQYPEALKDWYRNRTGKELNLEHPKTYNEKIQWMKLYDTTPLKTRLSDKLLVRDWVAEKIGEQYLIPLLGVYDNFDDIDFDALPNQFVIQTNNASATYRIVKDKAKFDINEARNFFNDKMKINYAWYGLELQYKDIVPKILITEYLENHGKRLDDYKVFCFDGKATYIEHMTERNEDGIAKRAFYDTDWHLMPFVNEPPRYNGTVPKPKNLDELLSTAETLSAGFYHVRVDFYILDNGDIQFGEMTFTPADGTSKWDPACYDEILGNLISLPIDQS